MPTPTNPTGNVDPSEQPAGVDPSEKPARVDPSERPIGGRTPSAVNSEGREQEEPDQEDESDSK